MSLRQAYRGGYDGRPGWWLHFDYDEALIADLKNRVPANQRTWDEGKERWWVSEEATERVMGIIPSLEAYLRQGALF